tara:strand:- start:10591 stop:11865 length:1275 start_codon:yes stop_codon:yes gene_type:complete
MHKKIIILVVFIGLLFDAFQGAVILYSIPIPSVSMLFRLLIMLLALFLIFNKRLVVNELAIIIFCFLLLFSQLFYWVANNYSDFSYGASMFLKAIYFLSVFKCLSVALERVETIYVFRAIKNVSIAYALLFMFSLFSGQGFLTYGIYTFGIKSFFKSGNDIGLVLFIMGSISLIGFKEMNQKKYMFSTFLCIFCMVLVASKTSLLLSFCLLMLSVLFVLNAKTSSPLYELSKKIFIYLFGALGVFGFYLSINFLVNVFSHQADMMLKLLELSEGPRTQFIMYGNKVLSNYSLSDYLFGRGGEFFISIGELFYQANLRLPNTPIIRAVESDFYDVIGTLGILTFIFISSFYLVFLCKAFLFLFRVKSLTSLLFLFSFTVLISHSILAGHVMYSAPVNMMFAVLAVIFSKIAKVKRLTINSEIKNK